MKTRNLLLGALILFGVGFAVYTFFLHGWFHQKARRDLGDELAAFVAREAARGGKGPALILAPPDDPQDPFPGNLARRLEHRLAGAGFAPVTLVRVPYNELIEDTGEPVTRETFLGLLRAHPDAALVVSQVGIPRLTAADLPAPHPRLVVASTVLMPYLEKFPRGLVDFAVLVKQNRDDPRADPALGALSRNFVLVRLRE